MSLLLSNPSSVSGLFQEKIIIPASATIPISSIVSAGVVAIKFWITLIDVTNSKVHMSEINVVVNGAIPKHNRFGHVGEKINISFNVNVVLGNIVLEAINSETVPINVTVTSETIYN